MHLFKGYSIVEQLQHSELAPVFRVVRTSDSEQVILKFYQVDITHFTNLPYIKNTFDSLQSTNSPNLLRIQELLFIEDGVALVTENFNAPPLDALFAKGYLFTLEESLTIILQVCSGLEEIHRKKILHQEITPHSIAFDTDSNEVRIIDYGICRVFVDQTEAEQLDRYLYISPEQTGRMNRSIDQRSDLYSLGVVFYKLLTGQCPFQFDDLLQLIHAHIAHQPVPPHKLNPQVPTTLSKIVLKLLCKEAEKRYQSASGLKADILSCLEKLKASGHISTYFDVGALDLRSKFQIPEKLYGRNHEIQKLLNTFENSASGQFETVLVGGYSGVGKSALINEMQKPLVAKRGVYTLGKYDQFKKAQPYSAILQALGGMIRQILSKQQAQVDDWAHKIAQQLNHEGQCLIEVLPILESLIGQQPELPKLNSIETQARFNRTSEALVKALSSHEHPFILFLDDLQWADLASLNLIEHLIRCAPPYMMLIMAYRDNEVDSHHPFTALIDNCTRDQLPLHEIALQPISLIDVQHLVSDTLQKDIAEIEPLAQELMIKTQGNPFF